MANDYTRTARGPEPLLCFDREAVATRLVFRYNDTKQKEDTPMNKTEFVTHVIQHAEDYPDIGEITVESAAAFLANLAPSPAIPAITAEEFAALWNQMLLDPSVMSVDGVPRDTMEKYGEGFTI